MSQVDFDITTADANTGALYRAAVNAALQALASNNSGIAPPSTTYPYMFWVDTSTATPTLKQRNGDDAAWVSLFQLSASQWLFVNDILINGVTIGLGGGNNATNTAVGLYALFANTTGTTNVALGAGALFSNTTGYANTAVGTGALGANISSNSNTAVGNSALGYATGAGNTAIGDGSGMLDSFGVNNTTTSNSLFIGYGTRPYQTGDTNEIVIGYNAIGAGSNTVTLGNNSITKTILKGTLKLNTVPTDYADNAAALAGGLVAGEVYRTGDSLKVVH